MLNKKQITEKDFEKGEYQWVATITNHLVFHNPGNMKARYLCADALEQLGYQAITGLWRNMYLSAAYELRNPDAAAGHNIRYMDNKDVMPYVSASLILDYLGINYDGNKAINIEKTFVIFLYWNYPKQNFMSLQLKHIQKIPSRAAKRQQKSLQY